MSKEYTALGLMSGTSGDGVDASIIKSDGKSKFDIISDKYFDICFQVFWSTIWGLSIKENLNLLSANKFPFASIILPLIGGDDINLTRFSSASILKKLPLMICIQNSLPIMTEKNVNIINNKILVL